MTIKGRTVMPLVADIDGQRVDLGDVELEVDVSHVSHEDGRVVAHLSLGGNRGNASQD